jgi:hypothetical protein
MVDLVSISFVKLLGLSPCNKKKHQHKEAIMEGIGRNKVKTYSFFHLRLCMTDQWNCSIQFTRPFLGVDRGPHDSQVLLGRPTLKDLSVSINNINDCWEIKNLPHVKPVSPSRFDREILEGTQVFEVQIIYKPVSRDLDEELKEKDRKNLPTASVEQYPEPRPSKSRRNRNLSSGERKRARKNCPKRQPRDGEKRECHQKLGGGVVENSRGIGRIGIGGNWGETD